MVIDKLLDENNKIVLNVINNNQEHYTNLKAFKKELSALQELEVVKTTERTFVFQTPEIYDTEKVFILFHSDLAIYNLCGSCKIYEYRWLMKKNKIWVEK